MTEDERIRAELEKFAEALRKALLEPLPETDHPDPELREPPE